MPSLDGPAMYGSDVHKASDLLYEVSAWLHDAHVGAQDFDAAHDALADRLVPVADAAVAEARALLARAERAEAQIRAVETRHATMRTAL